MVLVEVQLANSSSCQSQRCAAVSYVLMTKLLPILLPVSKPFSSICDAQVPLFWSIITFQNDASNDWTHFEGTVPCYDGINRHSVLDQWVSQHEKNRNFVWWKTKWRGRAGLLRKQPLKGYMWRIVICIIFSWVESGFMGFVITLHAPYAIQLIFLDFASMFPMKSSKIFQ